LPPANTAIPTTDHTENLDQTGAQKEWEYSWSMETRGRVCYRYTPKPTHKVLRLHENRSKRHSSLLIQMRTEKIGLRDFLYQRGNKTKGLKRGSLDV
jgi:hypothetical protein